MRWIEHSAHSAPLCRAPFLIPPGAQVAKNVTSMPVVQRQAAFEGHQQLARQGDVAAEFFLRRRHPPPLQGDVSLALQDVPLNHGELLRQFFLQNQHGPAFQPTGGSATVSQPPAPEIEPLPVMARSLGGLGAIGNCLAGIESASRE